MTTKEYKKLSKREKQHLAECFDGPPSKVTHARIRENLIYQAQNNCECHDCNKIARKLGIEPF